MINVFNIVKQLENIVKLCQDLFLNFAECDWFKVGKKDLEI